MIRRRRTNPIRRTTPRTPPSFPINPRSPVANSCSRSLSMPIPVPKRCDEEDVATVRQSSTEPPLPVSRVTARGIRDGGFTLMEIVVVLILLGLATALTAPALLSTPQGEGTALSGVVDGARRLAEGRGETLYLTVEAGGGWSITGVASREAGPLARGALDRYDGPDFRLFLSPLGTCGLDIRSPNPASLRVSPLGCQVSGP
jgi:prepilin-type N-terminal cleavage/methylation domain-containing protein